MKIENSIRVYGWKCSKKRGYSLIELIATLFMSTIILTIGVKLVISSYKAYRELENVSLQNNFIDDACLTINRLTNEIMIADIVCSDETMKNKNEIKISCVYKNNNKYFIKDKIIKLNRSKHLIIDIPNETGTNFILKDLKEFKVIKKKNINYIFIKHKSGEIRVQCI
ncbi:type II secretion system protein [Clostridium chauvoei]|uniref:Prepilin-type N-terminal cleavage/methylation domain-containing protein n=2 Tax=Clostridium chauvoei TaxID=46867 RepID=A0A1U6JEQ6_9CLOT|nr:type II secretion system protein [Clostridium chauvoei]ATD55206.1 hypothetical protein BTM20_08115 [Clostridium chauvoei]ATD57122.1 hypothetical protein BTM21_04930 [Clostridium chauvoei]MBX7279550.1 type II secretion system GspH family protein [Clostridium chauvoei]MBX7281919.1 type II secretion system GspH family protein [Clostridium chauvoei]MBX7284492.1 type II secretion system GspH family protein [Clostridium chauvoei]